MPRDVAVLAALSFWDYTIQADRHLPGTGDAFRATGRCFSVAAGRISFSYGLKGPAISLDTACSSSLSAIHLGQRLLWEQQCSSALVTAALLTLDSNTIGMLVAASMLAPDGRCKTLDAAADGYVRGEACVTLGLSTSQSCHQESFQPLGVVLGSAINQDGRSSSLTAPNGPSQQEVIRLALEDAGVGAHKVRTLEMHGTGTALGDPIEVGAAAAVFGAKGMQSGRDQVLELSAAKSHMGHAEPAAGGVGLQRALVSLLSNAVVGTLHLSAVNPYVVGALESGKMTAWMPRGPSTVADWLPLGGAATGISGFAFQGTNAHVVVSRGAVNTQLAMRAPRALEFRHQAHWFMPLSHFLAESCHANPWQGQAFVECALSRSPLAYLWDHVVKERPLLPGTCMLEAAYAAFQLVAFPGSGRMALTGCAIQAPLILGAITGAAAPPVLHCAISLKSGGLELVSGSGSVHFSGHVAHVVDNASVNQSMNAPFQVLAGMTTAGQAYSINCWGGEAVASLHAPRCDGYCCHPAASDAVTHLGAGYDLHADNMPRVPIGASGYVPSHQRPVTGCPGLHVTTTPVAASAAVLTGAGIRASRFQMLPHLCLHLISKPLGARLGNRDAPGQQSEDKLLYMSEDQVVRQAVNVPATLELDIGSGPAALVVALQKARASTVQQEAASAFAAGCAVLQQMSHSKAAVVAQAPMLGQGGRVLGHVQPPSSAIFRGLFAVAAVEDKLWALRHKVVGGAYGPTEQDARLVTAALGPAVSSSTCQPGDGSACLVSGGLSGLGMLTAVWLASLGSLQGPLVLLGRSGRAVGAEQMVDALCLQPHQVHMSLCDVACCDDALQAILLAGAALGTIVHAAGVLADSLLAKQMMGDFFKVASPKLSGLASVGASIFAHPVTSAQLFSSISGLLGNPGQANYGAVNAVLDAATGELQAKGIASFAVQWGPWTEAGMAARHSHLLARLERQGFGAVRPQAGLEVLHLLAYESRPACAPAVLVAAPLRWAALLQSRGHLRLLQDASTKEQQQTEPQKRIKEDDIAASTAPDGSHDQHADVEARIGSLVAAVLGVSLALDAPLMEAGLDSLGSVELRNAISSAFKVDLPATVTFDHPTPRQLAKYVGTKTGGAGKATAAGVPHQVLRSNKAVRALVVPSAGSQGHALAEITEQVTAIIAQVLGGEVASNQPLMEVSTCCTRFENALCHKDQHNLILISFPCRLVWILWVRWSCVMPLLPNSA